MIYESVISHKPAPGDPCWWQENLLWMILTVHIRQNTSLSWLPGSWEISGGSRKEPSCKVSFHSIYLGNCHQPALGRGARGRKVTYRNTTRCRRLWVWSKNRSGENTRLWCVEKTERLTCCSVFYLTSPAVLLPPFICKLWHVHIPCLQRPYFGQIWPG